MIRVRSATAVEPWPTGRVTLLDDAIHNMTPMGGIGANTALRDADLLRRQLIAVAAGQRELLPALQLGGLSAPLCASLPRYGRCDAGWPSRLAGDPSSAPSAQQRVDSCSHKNQREGGVRPVEQPHWPQGGIGQATLRTSQ